MWPSLLLEDIDILSFHFYYFIVAKQKKIQQYFKVEREDHFNRDKLGTMFLENVICKLTKLFLCPCRQTQQTFRIPHEQSSTFWEEKKTSRAAYDNGPYIGQHTYVPYSSFPTNLYLHILTEPENFPSSMVSNIALESC